MADTKLSALTEATTLGDADEAYANDSGTSKRITIANLRTTLLTANGMAAGIAAATAKTTPIAADSLLIVDSADSNAGKEVTLAQLAVPLQVARAHVQFAANGTINGSSNVTSITDSGTGDFVVNFTTAFADANYTSVAGVNTGTVPLVVDLGGTGGAKTTTTCAAKSYNLSGNLADPNFINVAFFK